MGHTFTELWNLLHECIAELMGLDLDLTSQEEDDHSPYI
jgi:hypothetical protein